MSSAAQIHTLGGGQTYAVKFSLTFTTHQYITSMPTTGEELHGSSSTEQNCFLGVLFCLTAPFSSCSSGIRKCTSDDRQNESAPTAFVDCATEVPVDGKADLEMNQPALVRQMGMAGATKISSNGDSSLGKEGFVGR